MYKSIVRDIESKIDSVEIFQLFDFLKTLAVINKVLSVQGEDTGIVEGCIERIQERIIYMKLV